MWQDALSLGNSAVVKVDIGGQSNSVTGTPNQITPEWKSFDIDVSSLTNETVYDVNIQLGANGITRNGYLDSIIGLAK